MKNGVWVLDHDTEYRNIKKDLTEIGCPEIIRFSCEIDEWIYGGLPGLKFERTGPLGTALTLLNRIRSLYPSWMRRDD